MDWDTPTQPIAVHVYIGDEGHNISLADKLRTDVGNVYPGTGNNHGFSATILTEKTGRQDISVFAINAGEGNNKLIGNGTVTISGRVKGARMNTGYARTIQDGYYHIASSLGDRWWLTVAGMSNDNGANVTLYDYSARDFDCDEQLFYFRFIDDGSGKGFYKITNKKSGKCLDVADGSVYMYGTDGNPTNVQQYEDNGSVAQQWAIQEIDGGDKGMLYTLYAKCSGFALDLFCQKTENNANISMHTGNESPAQLWRLVPYAPSVGRTLADGEYQIVPKLAESKAIGAAGTAAGANIALNSSYLGDGKQTFDVSYLGNGYYRIINKYSGLSLDVANASRKLGANVQLWGYNGNDTQKWIIKDCGGGYYDVVSKCNALSLNLYGKFTADGTNIQMWKTDLTGTQSWKFIPYKKTMQKTQPPRAF